MNLTRCFIAIEYPQIILNQIIKFRDEMRKTVPDGSVRWVSNSNLHLTIKFLGEVNSPVLDEVRVKMRNVCIGIQPFLLQIQGVGVFPNFRNPKIIWIGAEESDPLSSLARQCDDTCALSGILKEDRPFKPHLTIGRVTHNASGTHLRMLNDLIRPGLDMEFGKFEVGHLILFKSDLRPGGPVYTAIEKFPFIKN